MQTNQRVGSFVNELLDLCVMDGARHNVRGDDENGNSGGIDSRELCFVSSSHSFRQRHAGQHRRPRGQWLLALSLTRPPSAGAEQPWHVASMFSRTQRPSAKEKEGGNKIINKEK